MNTHESSGFVLSAHGVWLRKNWTDATFNFCYRGTYAPLLSDYLARQQEPFAFLDIGANQGLYSLLAARNEYCTRVLAFEPVRKTFRFLEANIGANPHSEKIRTLRVAVSDRHGRKRIAVKVGHSGAATLRKPLLRFLRGGERIRTIGPEQLAPLRPTDPLVIKIDVEGHEGVVLRSLASAGYLDAAMGVFFEVDHRWSDTAALLQLLREHGLIHFVRTEQGKHYDILATRHKLE